MRRETLENIMTIEQMNDKRTEANQEKWCWTVWDGDLEEYHQQNWSRTPETDTRSVKNTRSVESYGHLHQGRTHHADNNLDTNLLLQLFLEGCNFTPLFMQQFLLILNLIFQVPQVRPSACKQTQMLTWTQYYLAKNHFCHWWNVESLPVLGMASHPLEDDLPWSRRGQMETLQRQL